jgi:AcrR family transcriptional regulator
MRRIARDLHVSPMALYWHVANKDELLAEMVDAVEGEIQIPPPSGDWRADMTATARRYRDVLQRHGWLIGFIGMRRSLGPNELLHIEHSLGSLDGLGLTIRQAFNVLMAVETYYLGFAVREQQEIAMDRARESVSPDKVRAATEQEAERLRATNQYPHLAELFEEGFLTRDERFEFGLARLLDGIAAELLYE